MEQADENEASASTSPGQSRVDSFVYLALKAAEAAGQHPVLRVAGPNEIRDVLLQIYPAEEWLSRGNETFLEFGKSFFQFEAAGVAETVKMELTLANIPQLGGSNSKGVAVQFLTREGPYFQLLMLELCDGEWAQGQLVFSIGKKTVSLLRSHHDAHFPEDRMVRATSRLHEWVQRGVEVEVRREKLKAQFPWPSLW